MEVLVYGGDAKWVVVLEADRGIEEWALLPMLQILSDANAAALHCLDRYALQMEIFAGGQAEALFVALARWQSAHRAIHRPPSDVVRAEVLSYQEFERDCRLANGETLGTRGQAGA